MTTKAFTTCDVLRFRIWGIWGRDKGEMRGGKVVEDGGLGLVYLWFKEFEGLSFKDRGR